MASILTWVLFNNKNSIIHYFIRHVWNASVVGTSKPTIETNQRSSHLRFVFGRKSVVEKKQHPVQIVSKCAA